MPLIPAHATGMYGRKYWNLNLLTADQVHFSYKETAGAYHMLQYDIPESGTDELTLLHSFSRYMYGSCLSLCIDHPIMQTRDYLEPCHPGQFTSDYNGLSEDRIR